MDSGDDVPIVLSEVQFEFPEGTPMSIAAMQWAHQYLVTHPKIRDASFMAPGTRTALLVSTAVESDVDHPHLRPDVFGIVASMIAVRKGMEWAAKLSDN